MAWTTRRQTGLLIDEEGAEHGYTLYSKIVADLLDEKGRIVHRWTHPGMGSRARLLPNGNLLANLKAPEDAGGAEKIGGSSRGLVELDWDSNVVWEYRNDFLHHEFARCEDGTTIAVAWEEVPDGLAEKIQGGVPDPDGAPMKFCDTVLTIDDAGELVDTWHSHEHLDPEIDILCPLDARKEWTHCNSIAVMPDGRWLLSFRLTSTLAIVNPATGAIEWRWSKDNSHQHDATPLPNGNITIFDNGCHRPGQPTFSRIVELDPDSGEIVWWHRADIILSMYSYMGSGAQRLAGGNTLITECATGRIMEVTHDHRVVWEFVSPYLTESPAFGPTPAIGNASRIPYDDERLAGRDLDPARFPFNERFTDGESLEVDQIDS